MPSRSARTPLTIGTALLALALGLVPEARAHELLPPRPHEQPQAAWPGGKPSAHDVLVPVVLTVTAEGDVRDVKVEASLGPAFDEAAAEAARRWKFDPASSAGKPVDARIRAVIRFVGAPSAAEPPQAASPRPPQPAQPAPGQGAQGAQGAAVPQGSSQSDQVQVVGHGEGEHQVKAGGGVRVQGERQPPRSASEVVRDRAVIQAAPHRTASDALLVVPGVYITQHSGEGKAYQIFFRGFDAVHGQDVELWAGGAPVNDVSNIHGQGYADLHFVPPEVIKEIRSTPGTYDPRQGDFAVAGTIRLELGHDEPGVTAKAQAGSFGSRRFFLAYRPREASDATFAAFEVYSTEGFGPARAARRASAIAQTSHDLGDGATARVMVSSYSGRFDSAGVLRLADVDSGKVDRFATYDPRQGGASSRTQLVLSVEKAEARSRWSFSPFFVLRGFRLRSDFTGYLQSPTGDSVQQISDATAAGATGYYRALVPLISSRDVIEAGFFARNDWIEQSQRRLSIDGDGVTATEVDARVKATDVAGYLDAAVYPHRRLMLRAGARVDGLAYSTEDRAAAAGGQARSAQGAHLGKKASAEGQIGGGLSAVVSYGEGFRSPQARGLADGQTAPFTTVTSYEAGMRYRDGRVRGSLALFRSELSDDLVFDQSTARNERVPATRRTGLTAEYAAQLVSEFVSSASLTFTRAEFRATDGGFARGDLVPYVPQLVVRSDLAWTPRLGEIGARGVTARVGSGLTFLHERPMPYGELGHDVLLVDAGASVRVGEAQVGLDAFNLLDARWFDGEFVYASRFNPAGPASLVPARHVTAGAPRTLMASLALFL